jgi:hypothetical protein
LLRLYWGPKCMNASERVDILQGRLIEAFGGSAILLDEESEREQKRFQRDIRHFTEPGSLVEVQHIGFGHLQRPTMEPVTEWTGPARATVSLSVRFLAESLVEHGFDMKDTREDAFAALESTLIWLSLRPKDKSFVEGIVGEKWQPSWNLAEQGQEQTA